MNDKIFNPTDEQRQRQHRKGKNTAVWSSRVNLTIPSGCAQPQILSHVKGSSWHHWEQLFCKTFASNSGIHNAKTWTPIKTTKILPQLKTQKPGGSAYACRMNLPVIRNCEENIHLLYTLRDSVRRNTLYCLCYMFAWNCL